jgi:hypothetical protein
MITRENSKIFELIESKIYAMGRHSIRMLRLHESLDWKYVRTLIGCTGKGRNKEEIRGKLIKEKRGVLGKYKSESNNVSRPVLLSVGS